MTGFLGPNGAGRSTTLRVMVGLTAPTAGSATIDGRRFADLTKGSRWACSSTASAQHAGGTGRSTFQLINTASGRPTMKAPGEAVSSTGQSSVEG